MFSTADSHKEHIHKHCKYHEKIIPNVYDNSYYDY